MLVEIDSIPRNDCLVTVTMQTARERRYTDEDLARIAYSQDRLLWRDGCSGIAECKDVRKLRRLPAGVSADVKRVGKRAEIVIRDSRVHESRGEPYAAAEATPEAAGPVPLLTDHTATIRGLLSVAEHALLTGNNKLDDLLALVAALRAANDKLHAALI
jgi:hypothetical protein